MAMGYHDNVQICAKTAGCIHGYTNKVDILYMRVHVNAKYVFQLRLNNGYKVSKACLAGGSYVSQLNITFITLVAI